MGLFLAGDPRANCRTASAEIGEIWGDQPSRPEDIENLPPAAAEGLKEADATFHDTGCLPGVVEEVQDIRFSELQRSRSLRLGLMVPGINRDNARSRARHYSVQHE